MKNLQDYIDTHPIDYIPSNTSNDYTSLPPIGSKTCPDLVLAHTTIAGYVTQNSIALLGLHGHMDTK